MIKRSILLTALLAGGLMAANAADTSRNALAVPVVQATAKAAPVSRVEARDALESSVAGAVIGALSEQFRESRVEIRIDGMTIEPTSVVAREVSGHGRLQLGGQGEWLPFRFRTGYDTQAALALAPSLVIGAQAPGKVLADDSRLVTRLQADLQRRLQDEFAQQPVKLAFERVTAVDAGGRYQRIEATGTADFLSEGTAKASAHALYDRSKGRFVQMAYELGTEANWHSSTDLGHGAAALAVR